MGDAANPVGGGGGGGDDDDVVPKKSAAELKRQRLDTHDIAVPLPTGLKTEVGAEADGDAAVTYGVYDYAPGALWADWREKTRKTGTTLVHPGAPNLFGTGAAKMPHKDPASKIVADPPTKEEVAEKKAFQKKLGEHSAKHASLLKVSEKRSSELLGMCVRIARAHLNYTLGMAIEEPSPEQLEAINNRIQQLMPGAPAMTAAEVKCWCYHEKPVMAGAEDSKKYEYYCVRRRPEPVACCLRPSRAARRVRPSRAA